MNSLLSTIAGLLPIASGAILTAQVPAASVPSESTHAIWWILGLAAFATIFNQIVTAWNNITGRFKEKETAGPEYVTREACHEAHQKTETCVKELRTEFEASIKDLEEKFEDRTTELRNIIRNDIAGGHKRIDQILAAVSELKGKVEKK